MTETVYLSDHLLIAMPGLEDPNFSRSVTYVCQHNDSGALGITINRPSDLTIGDVLEQMGIDCSNVSWGEQKVLIGGPVHQDRGFVLHGGNKEWNSTYPVSSEISLTTSKDILHALAEGNGPAESLLALGYAGWGAGQLEDEILQNSWLSTQADSQILFHAPLDDRWQRAAARIGIDIQTLSGAAGHA